MLQGLSNVLLHVSLWFSALGFDIDPKRPFLTADLPSTLIELPILSPIPLSGGWVGGYTMRVAAEIAMDIVNSQQKILPGYKITTTWYDDTCNPDRGVQEVLKAWTANDKWVALGNAGCSAVCKATANIAPTLRIPQMSYGCASGELTNMAKYPHFQRMMTVENDMAIGFETIGLEWKWTQIHIISGAKARFDAPSQYVLDYFTGHDHITAEWLTPRNGNWKQVNQLMGAVKTSQQRALVVLGYEIFYRQVVCASFLVGIPKGVVWMSVGWHKAGWWNDWDCELMGWQAGKSGNKCDDETQTGLEPQCTPELIADYYEGGIGAAGIGKPVAADLDKQLDCLEGFTAGEMRDHITNHLAIGYPEGENMLAGDPYWGIMANGADGICAWAYTLRHMIFDKGHTVEQLQRPEQAIYEEMVRYKKSCLDTKMESGGGGVDFFGASGTVNWRCGNDLPGILGVNQAQRDTASGLVVKTLVATIDLEGTFAKLDGMGFRWWDGTTEPGSAFKECAAGSVLNALGECELCPAGTYHDCLAVNGVCRGSKNCMDCPKAYVNPIIGGVDRIACKACEVGKFMGESGKSECKECDAGNFSVAPGSSACEQCPPGKVTGSPGLAECSSCRVGMYVSGLGNTACYDCAATAAKNAKAWTTIERTETDGGSFEMLRISGADDASACACEEEFYKKDGQCETCPDGMSCSTGSDDMNFMTASPSDGPAGNLGAPYPVVLPRHWSATSEPTSVFTCRTEENCPGGAPESCGERLEDRSCARCEVDYRWNGEDCTPCTSVETSRLLFPIIPIVVGPMVIAGIYKFFGDTIDRWGSWQNTCTCLGFIVLNHYQILDLVRGSDVVLPEMLQDLFEGWSFTNDFASILKAECAGIRDFQSSFIVKTLSPLFILLIVLFTKLVSVIVSKVTKLEWLNMEPNRLANAFGSIMFTFFSAISGLSLLLFKCTENPNGKNTLTADLSVVCGDDQWSGMLVAAIAAVLVYCVGFGGIFAKVIIEAPKNKNFDNPGYQMRWKFLFIKFRPTVWWWALLFLLKNFLVNLGFVLFTYGVGQIFWSMTITILYTILAVAFMPYRARIANFLELCASLSIVYVTALVLWFTERDEKYDDQVALTAGTISFMPLLLGVLTAGKLAFFGLMKKDAEPAMVAEQYDKFVGSMKQYMTLSEHKPELAKTFFETIGEWDRWHMVEVANVVSFELLGKGVTKGAVRLVDWTSSRNNMMKQVEGQTNTDAKTNVVV